MAEQAKHINSQSEPPNHTHKLGNKQFALYLKSQPKLSTLIYNIEKYLANYDPFYYNAYLHQIKGKDLDTLQIQMTAQYNKLISGKSFLHKINNAVFSRKKCLQKIKRDLTKVQAVLTMFKKAYFRKAKQQDNIYIEYTQQQGYTTVQIDSTIEHSIKMISNLFVDMGRLRDMSLYIIETIHRWRVGIEQWMDRCQNHARIDFLVKNQDDEHGQSIRVYDLLQEDTDFLWQSRLCQHIWMQFKRDPLIIRNVVNVSQRKQKQILEKYFVQILYPNGQQIVDKTIKAIQMLNFVYKPKQINLYEEQQKLIENYLTLQRKNNLQIGFQMDDNDDNARALNFLSTSRKASRIKKSVSQSKISKVTIKKQFRNQIESDNKKWQQNLQFESPYSTKSPQKHNKRGWVFGKQLKKPASERIREIIKKHQIQMTYLKNHKGIIKPFNITNLPQKKSIALAYLSQKNNIPLKKQEDGWIYSEDQTGRRKSRVQDKKNVVSQGQENKFQSQIYLDREKQETSRRKMYQSLVKINNIIQEDPKQHENEQQTPKARPKKQQLHLAKQERLNNIKNRFYLNKRQKSSEKQKQELSKTINKNDTQNKQNSKANINVNTNTNINANLNLNSSNVKDNKKLKQSKISQYKGKEGRKLIESGIKINTIFDTHDEKNEDINLEGQIQVEQEETPLNFKQFFEVFRADTKEKGKNQSRVVNQMVKSNLRKSEVKQLGGSLPVRKAIDKKRQQMLKSAALLPYFTQKKKKPRLTSDLKKSLSKSKSQASDTSFKSYTKIQPQPPTQPLPPPPSIPTQYLTLKTKQITKDIIPKYIRHLCSQIPLSSQSFTNYHTMAYQSKMISVLEDSTINSIIFDIEAEKDGKIGQAVVIQTLSTTLKMRYTIQFINVNRFQSLVPAVCRIAEELLATSPCEQVVFKLVEDKADPVSTHFINLVDQPLKNKAQKFSFFHILQKSILGLSNQSLYQRVYVMQAKKKNHIKQAISQKYKTDWRKRVAGSNYRSLVFETQCVALTSNFKLRSDNLNKATVQIYKQESIGILYVLLLQKIVTKYHLKQLKVASLSVNDADETTGLVKKSPFLRTIFYGLLELIKKSGEQQKGMSISQWVKKSITRFTNMTDLLNYLSYKQYDQTFKFDFLVESRFILNHQLTFSQVNLSSSLDFVLQNSSNMLLINNHHNFPIHELSRNSSPSLNSSFSQSSSAYLLPTTQDNLKLFLMSAKQYLNCSDSLDLYSYVELLFRQSTKKQRQNVQQIVIPDLTKRKLKVNSVKMYDGFLRLFPEREFYSASMIRVQNLWENFYPNAVISKPIDGAIVFDYPIIVGFYDSVIDMPIASYLLKQEK